MRKKSSTVKKPGWKVGGIGNTLKKIGGIFAWTAVIGDPIGPIIGGALHLVGNGLNFFSKGQKVVDQGMELYESFTVEDSTEAAGQGSKPTKRSTKVRKRQGEMKPYMVKNFKEMTALQKKVLKNQEAMNEAMKKGFSKVNKMQVKMLEDQGKMRKVMKENFLDLKKDVKKIDAKISGIEKNAVDILSALANQKLIEPLSEINAYSKKVLSKNTPEEIVEFISEDKTNFNRHETNVLNHFDSRKLNEYLFEQVHLKNKREVVQYFLLVRGKFLQVQIIYHSHQKNGPSEVQRALDNFSQTFIGLEQALRVTDQEEGTKSTYDENGITFLHHAAISGNLEIFEEAMKHEPKDLNPKSLKTGETPLHYASEEGHDHIIDFFLKNFVETFEATDEDGNTPLHYAAMEDHKKVVKKILSNETINFEPLNKEGYSPFDLAALNGCANVCKEFLDLFGNKIPSHKMLDQSLISKSRLKNCNQRDWNQLKSISEMTPLHLAAQGGKLKVVKVFCDAGVNLDFKNQFGDTPLHLAAEKNHPKVVDLLLEHCKEKLPQNQFQMTPVHVAAMMGSFKVLNVFMAKVPGWDKPSGNGLSALDYAEKYNHQEIVDALTHRNPDETRIDFIKRKLKDSKDFIRAKEIIVKQLRLDDEVNFFVTVFKSMNHDGWLGMKSPCHQYNIGQCEMESHNDAIHICYICYDLLNAGFCHTAIDCRFIKGIKENQPNSTNVSEEESSEEETEEESDSDGN